MSPEALWQAFAETGDPFFYLLYSDRRTRPRQETDSEDDSAPGLELRPGAED